jgi:acetyl/propionyl-CoA carboxylase alpha subunit
MASNAKYAIQVGEKHYEVSPKDRQGLEGEVNGHPYALDLLGNAEEGFHLIYKNRSLSAQVVDADPATKSFRLLINGTEYQVQAADRFDRLLKKLGLEDLAQAGASDLKAPMPGLVLETKVAPGEEVAAGQALVVLEAMKMENVLKAEADGLVKTVPIEKGQAVDKNQVLIEFES